MENTDKIAELEARVKVLEGFFDKIKFGDAGEITLTNCPIGDISIRGNRGNLTFESCPIGCVLDSEINDSEVRLDELECRLSDLNEKIDETEEKIDELEDIIDEVDELEEI